MGTPTAHPSPVLGVSTKHKIGHFHFFQKGTLISIFLESEAWLAFSSWKILLCLDVSVTPLPGWSFETSSTRQGLPPQITIPPAPGTV